MFDCQLKSLSRVFNGENCTEWRVVTQNNYNYKLMLNVVVCVMWLWLMCGAAAIEFSKTTQQMNHFMDYLVATISLSALQILLCWI